MFDLDLFSRELHELVARCGGEIAGPLNVSADRPVQVAVLPDSNRPVVEGLKAFHSVTPIVLNFSIKTQSVGNWSHDSGDNRRLDPELKEENRRYSKNCK